MINFVFALFQLAVRHIYLPCIIMKQACVISVYSQKLYLTLFPYIVLPSFDQFFIWCVHNYSIKVNILMNTWSITPTQTSREWWGLIWLAFYGLGIIIDGVLIIVGVPTRLW